MKLTNQYNRSLIPAIIVIFLVSTISSYFLIRDVLQGELDRAILRTKKRIENYTAQHQHIPDLNSFDDLVIRFAPASIPAGDTGFSSATQYIREQKKFHLSR